MKIGVGNSDAPGDQTVRTDFDPFLCHDQCAIHKAEIAYRAGSIFPEGERTTGITRDMIANSHRSRGGRVHVAKNLRGLAIKSFTENHIWRNRFVPPISLNPARAVYVTHGDEG